MIAAVIPARGGSKRIPDKNIRPFFGKPIIAYSIEAAFESGVFDRVVVSTDSERIAEVALKYGAEVPFFRPAELSDDHANTDAVILHAVGWLIRSASELEYICCIYAATPFITGEQIRRGLEVLRNEGAAGAFPVARYPGSIFRALRINERGRLEMIWPEHEWTRSQDLPEAYQDAAMFYWADVPKLLSSGKLLSEDTLPIVLPRHFVHDIDTLEDWEAAEAAFRTLRAGVSG